MTSLEEMAIRYGAKATEAAYNGAVQHGAKDPLAYAAQTLKNQHPESTSVSPASTSSKLLCDGCQRPAWLDSLVVREGRALCTDRPDGSQCVRMEGARLPSVQVFRSPEDEEKLADWYACRARIEETFQQTWAMISSGTWAAIRRRIAELSAEKSKVNGRAEPAFRWLQ